MSQEGQRIYVYGARSTRTPWAMSIEDGMALRRSKGHISDGVLIVNIMASLPAPYIQIAPKGALNSQSEIKRQTM